MPGRQPLRLWQFDYVQKSNVTIYDPQVEEDTMRSELDYQNTNNVDLKNIDFCSDPYESVKGSHAIVILTEWDEFKTYDYNLAYTQMQKPCFIFDGRNVLELHPLADIGFRVDNWQTNEPGLIGARGFDCISHQNNIWNVWQDFL